MMTKRGTMATVRLRTLAHSVKTVRMVHKCDIQFELFHEKT